MARISFSSLVESITGKLAGSVFQDSYQGFQIRTRVSPRNPQSDYQQLRRGEFAFLSQGWRYLSDTDRQTWIDNAPPGMQGLNFYLQSNINLVLIGLAPVAAYAAAATPSAFELSIPVLDGSVFTVQAAGTPDTVPVDTSLLIQATYEKEVTKIFTNPSQYSPVISFPAGTVLSTPVDIAANWISRYGQFTSDKRICLASNLISVVNGARSAVSIICANESAPASYYVVDSSGTFSGEVPIKLFINNSLQKFLPWQTKNTTNSLQVLMTLLKFSYRQTRQQVPWKK